jgi:hypothetical protein
LPSPLGEPFQAQTRAIQRPVALGGTEQTNFPANADNK